VARMMSSRAVARKNAKQAKVQDAAKDETADVGQGRRDDGLVEQSAYREYGGEKAGAGGRLRSRTAHPHRRP
jgi:hypothetical protein